MPAPTNTDTSKLYQSCCPEPNGPSTNTYSYMKAYLGPCINTSATREHLPNVHGYTEDAFRDE